MPHQLRSLFKYHRWASSLVVDAAGALPPSELVADRGLAFGSVLGTLNHILLADVLWYGRMTGAKQVGPFDPSTVKDMWAAPASDWAGVTPGLAAAHTELLAQTDRWEGLLESLVSEDRLDASFSYSNTRGDALSAEYRPILHHIVNHATHHRGQISAVLTQADLPAPALDYLYFLKDDA